MRFWDTSALSPLVVAERGTALAERLLRDDPAVVVWTLTRVELLSALARRRREEPAAARRLLGAKREILAAWPQYRAKFVKVFPKEYRRALAELSQKKVAA